MKIGHSSRLIAVTLIFAVMAGCASRAPDPAASPATPDADVAALAQRVARLEDLNAIKRLQRAYGYYVDEGQWDRVAELFSSDGSIEIGLDGVYRGRDRIREYLHALGGGRNGLEPGQLNEHFQLMPVVTLGTDGTTAQGTWRAVILNGRLGRDAFWGEGPYINEYVKEDGVWKIQRSNLVPLFRNPYRYSWGESPHHGSVNVSGMLGLTPDGPSSLYRPFNELKNETNMFRRHPDLPEPY